MPITCTDIFANDGGDWVGNLAGQLGTNGNIALDPLFCDFANGNLTLDFASPCLFAECGRMGAWDLGCPAAGVEDVSVLTGPRIVPNPMTESCRLRFQVPEAGRVSVLIVDVAGRIVRRLHEDWTPRGDLSLLWNRRDDAGRSVAGGLYLARITSPAGSMMERVVVLR